MAWLISSREKAGLRRLLGGGGSAVNSQGLGERGSWTLLSGALSGGWGW